MHDPLFAFHKLNDEGIKKANLIGDAFTDCLNRLRNFCPEGREFALVKTKLEEASFFAKKAMSIDPKNQAT